MLSWNMSKDVIPVTVRVLRLIRDPQRIAELRDVHAHMNA
jgi:hypothetical protein